MAAQIPWIRTSDFSAPSSPADGAVELGTLTHGLGGAPDLVTLWAECTSAEHGYSVGDRLLLPCALHRSPWHSGEDTFVCIAGDTDLALVFNNDNGDGLRLLRHKTTGALVSLTLPSWTFQLTAARYFIADDPPNGGIDPVDATWQAQSAYVDTGIPV